MHTKLSLAALAIIAVIAVAAAQLNQSSTSNPTSPNSSPEPISIAPAPTRSAPTPRPTIAAPPALTRVFTSGIYGVSASYPDGWEATPGKLAWTMKPGTYAEPMGDLIVDPTHDFLWLKLASMPLGDQPFQKWANGYLTGRECIGARYVDIDGVRGLYDDQCSVVLVATGGRGYLIGAHFCGCELGSVSQWRQWFSDVLKTVHLEPAAAVDAD